jgi:hypothetical protein
MMLHVVSCTCCLLLSETRFWSFPASDDAEKERAYQWASKSIAESYTQWNQGKFIPVAWELRRKKYLAIVFFERWKS